ncbi:hypothetical protein A9Q87_04635 [Flavobacteriales bacterium 34_180_T64]|nr:hypothetical protein A9Q87_04635 [Flavobacteriales bacterium 34_180_T64]
MKLKDIVGPNRYEENPFNKEDHEELKSYLTNYLKQRPFTLINLQNMLYCPDKYIEKAFNSLIKEGKSRIVPQFLKNELRSKKICNLHNNQTYYTTNTQYHRLIDSKKESPTDLVIDVDNDPKTQLLAKKLDGLLVDNKEELKPPPIAWKISDRILGTLGNFSMIIGKAKSRKSFFINIAISCAISNDKILNKFKSHLPADKNEVLYFDTEQGKYHVQLALKRICKQTNIDEPSNLKVYGLRSLKPRERLELIGFAINNNPNVGFVVIDGIKDLVTSINSEEEATSIASSLLKWTEDRNIHIVCVLHQNKGDANARGHIGTELVNKAETVLSVTKAEADKEISVVEAVQTRNIEPEPFAFIINEAGIPILIEDYVFRVETNVKQKNDLISMTEGEQYDLLIDIYKIQDLFTYSELVQQIKIIATRKFNKNIGDNKIKLFITQCKNEKWLIQEKKKAPYSLGHRSITKINPDPHEDGIDF